MQKNILIEYNMKIYAAKVPRVQFIERVTTYHFPGIRIQKKKEIELTIATILSEIRECLEFLQIIFLYILDL